MGELSNSYDTLVSNSRKHKSGDTEKVLDNLEVYMNDKHNEEKTVLGFIFKKLNNDYIDILNTPNATLKDLNTKEKVSDVYKRMMNSPRIQQFFTDLQKHREQLYIARSNKEEQDRLQKLKEESPDDYKQRKQQLAQRELAAELLQRVNRELDQRQPSAPTMPLPDVSHRLPQPPRQGQGLKPKTIIIPDNKNDLLDRLRVIIAAKHAGHTDVEDERKAILQRLFEKHWIDEKMYKKFSQLKLSF